MIYTAKEKIETFLDQAKEYVENTKTNVDIAQKRYKEDKDWLGKDADRGELEAMQEDYRKALSQLKIVESIISQLTPVEAGQLKDEDICRAIPCNSCKGHPEDAWCNFESFRRVAIAQRAADLAEIQQERERIVALLNDSVLAEYDNWQSLKSKILKGEV